MIRSGEFYARSASDDKGPIIMLLAALQELQKEKQELAYNVKIILDSEEERGSPHLLSSVQRYSDLLSSDYLVVSDGPMHDSGATYTHLWSEGGLRE
jgi:acetylornithine deacetylase/succinyl-diaminopimelate desuccinylase-like protein